MAKAQKQDDQPDQEQFQPFDPVAFSQSMMRAYESAQPIIEDFIEKRVANGSHINFDPLNVSETYAEFLESFWNNPDKFWQLQIEYWQKGLALWQESTLKFMGEEGSKSIIEPPPGDRRFKAQEWQESALFDFIKQSYLCLLYTSPSPRDRTRPRMPSSA